MHTGRCIFCVLLSGIFSQYVNAVTETYFLDEICGSTINMATLGTQSGRLLLRRPDTGLVNFNCVILVRAPDTKHLILKLSGLEIVAPFGCNRDYVQFFDGFSSAKPLSNQLCGYQPPLESFVTTETSATIAFSKRLDFMSDQFEVIFTAHRKEPCEEGEFRCNNGLCIVNNLYCDGYDNCGDGSDVCILSIYSIMGIAIAIAILFIIVALVVAIVIHRRRRRKLEKWHRLHHTYSFNGSTTLSLPRSRRDYSLPRSVRSFKDGSLPRSGTEYIVPREREDSINYATVMKDKANHKMHILNAASLPRDTHSNASEFDHVVSFRSYPAPVPDLDDDIVHSTPQPLTLSNGFFYRSAGTDSAPGSRNISRHQSSRSTASGKANAHAPRDGSSTMTSNVPVQNIGNNVRLGEDMTDDFDRKNTVLMDGRDILFHSETTSENVVSDRDKRGSFDLVQL